MRKLFPLALLLVLACKNDPGEGELTGTMSPAQAGQIETASEQQRQTDDASGTFGGSSPDAPGQPASTGTHPGATGTDATTLTDPNVSATAPPATRTTT